MCLVHSSIQVDPMTRCPTRRTLSNGPFDMLRRTILMWVRAMAGSSASSDRSRFGEEDRDVPIRYSSVPMPGHWLVKSEPNTYPFSKLVGDRSTAWDGIRNFEARNNLRS